MAKWDRERVDSANLNGGNEYSKDSVLAVEELNAMVNAGLYAQDFVEELTYTPDVSEANQVGTPKVEFVLSPNADTNKPYVRFKFSNLKGERGEQGIQGEKGENGTSCYVNGVATDVNFTSDPQTQLNSKASKDLSNVTYPTITMDGAVRTGAGDRVVETYISSDGKTWYRKWASGWKECGVLRTGNWDNATVSLPISFTNTNYIAVGTGYDIANQDGVTNIRIESKTTNSILCKMSWQVGTSYGGYENGTGNIYCCGY